MDAEEAYLLSLDVQFDIVINLDGFNEVALPLPYNVKKSIFPSYPRDWFFRVSKTSDPNLLTKLAKLETLQLERTNWARLFKRTRLFQSVAAGFIWKVRDQTLKKKRGVIESEIHSYKVNEKNNISYVRTGPYTPFKNDEDLFNHLVML